MPREILGCSDEAPFRLTHMSKAVGIIPARWGSTRFPGKPLHLHRGQTAAPTRLGTVPARKNLDQLIIATDDLRIAEAAFDWGAEVAMTSAEPCKRHRPHRRSRGES